MKEGHEWNDFEKGYELRREENEAYITSLESQLSALRIEVGRGHVNTLMICNPIMETTVKDSDGYLASIPGGTSVTLEAHLYSFYNFNL